MQLLVVGMHRSGTSGVTRLLNLAGAWFGPDGIATEANEENPEGFWERRDVRAVCDGLLHAGGFDWWRLTGFAPEEIPPDARARWLAAFEEVLVELDEHPPWVVKEPRLCVLLPVLAPLLRSPVAVHVVREPLEVAQSLRRRNGFPVPAGLALWELYTVRAFAATAELPRVLVRYGDLMADPVATTRRLVEELEGIGVRGLAVPSESLVLGFIRADLHRQHRDASERRERLNEHQALLAARIDDGSILTAGDVGTVSAGAWEQLAELEQSQRVAAQVEGLAGQLDRMTTEVGDRLTRLEAQSAAEAAALTERLEAMTRYRDVELARRRELGRLADEALGTVDRQLERVDRSRVGRVARGLMSARQVLSPGATRTDAGPLDHPRRELAERRRELQVRTRQEPAPGRATGGGDGAGPADGATFATGHPLVRRTRPLPPGGRGSDRPSVAVLSWDVGHNPLGRANVLAEVLARHFDVELWGAQFDRYGSEVWAPLRHAATPVNVIPGGPFPDHLRTLEQVVGEIDADALWVSKPRLPSYLMGIMAKAARNRPLVLDVDDHELAFFGEDTGIDLAALAAAPRDDLRWPFERSWTRACDAFIDAADQVTVSNVALQARYGGLIVPHARDETRFDPALIDRDEVRARLGLAPDQRVLLFGGTPRAHKGVIEVLEALERLGDERCCVLMFGTREFDEMRGRLGPLARWARVLPPQPFEDLPALVAAADLACVIQDPTHPVSRYQMPAKVSDALAMAVPCLVTPTPPLAPLVEAGVLQVLAPGDLLHERIARVFEEGDDARERAARGRELFLRDHSYAAVAEVVAPLFTALVADPPPLSPRLRELAEAPARAFGGSVGTPAPAAVRRPRREVDAVAPLAPGTVFDVAVFWKQNDSGLYGRRQDMITDELRRSDRVGSIVHFDNPISPESLLATYRASRSSSADQGRLVVAGTLARVLGRRDEPGVHRHTFLFGARYSRRLGRPARSAYAGEVRRVLARRGVGRDRPLLVWGYPANDDLPALIDALDPAVVVADVVDDNRSWYEEGSPFIARLERNYQEVLARSDLVLANCAPVAEAMARFAPEVHVVPNGAELPTGAPAGPRPPALRGIPGPVIAYVGNLSSRLDLDLLEAVARARPGWSIVLVGSAHLDRGILALDRLPNVHFPGVLPYPQVRAFLAHVDVGLIPHLDNDMTRAMNPLKAFVYAAAGVPVVSTPVANLVEMGDHITVAADTEGFVAAIEDQLARGRRPVDPDLLAPHSWTRRVEQVFSLLDAELARTAGPDRDGDAAGADGDPGADAVATPG